MSALAVGSEYLCMVASFQFLSGFLRKNVNKQGLKNSISCHLPGLVPMKKRDMHVGLVSAFPWPFG